MVRSTLSFAASPPIKMVGGAVAWIDPMPNPEAGAPAGVRVAKAVVGLLVEAVRWPGSKAGSSILFPPVAGTWVTTRAVIICPF